MTNTVNKRKVNMPAGMKHKMMAAVSMLLVSSIMVVSSTYAWFTLSTAPEVTGITTNVGANGNLEIALLDTKSYASNEADLGIESDINDSMAVQSVAAANETWGNLVDLSPAEYHLGDIILNPSRLNLGSDGTITGTTLLKGPTYGSDGRVVDINKDTFSGTYDSSAWIVDQTKAGVRVIGASSGVTKRSTAYRNAVSNRAANVSSAKSAATTSLTQNGQQLADIMIAHALGNDTGFTLAQVQALQSMVNSLQTANNSVGSALKNSVLATTFSDENSADLTDDQVDEISTAMASATPDALDSISDIQKPDGYDTAVAKWSTTQVTIGKAKTKADELVNSGSSTFTYEQIKEVMESLLNKQYVEVNGISNPSSSDKDELVKAIIRDDTTANIVMQNGSGVYADIADLVGDYNVSGLYVTVSYGTLTDVTVKAKMSTSVNATGEVPGMSVGNAPVASAAGAGTKQTISDTYGYALDFGFRTNAAASNLQLQTDEKQRVYDGNKTDGSDKTQGGGSTMTFNTNDKNVFSLDEVRALMNAVRVVFVTPAENGYTILGVAKADITSTNTDGVDRYTGGTLVKDDGTAVADGSESTATGIKANLYLYNYTTDADGVITITNKKTSGTKTVTVDGEEKTVDREDGTLVALEQNTAKKVTALVYLDGDIVDNTMVANANNSMSGKLNLQFSSSATLVPMENSTMRTGGTTATVTETGYTEKAAAGATYTYGEYTGTVKTGYKLYTGNTSGKVYYKADSSADGYVQLTKNNFSNAITITTSTTGGSDDSNADDQG